MDILVSTDWLADHLEDSALRIVDATAFLPGSDRDPRAEYEAGHIPGALFLDLPTLCDASDPRPGMLPPPAQFAERMEALGLGDGCRIVIYDNSPIKSAARAWWMFQLFGLTNVALLDGGLGKWVAEQRVLESGVAKLQPCQFEAAKREGCVVTLEDVLANLETGAAQLVDARALPRFTGEEPEPRAGMASGHIPGSVCLPYAWLFNPDGTYKHGDALLHQFKEAGVDLAQPLIVSCGSGVTAAVILFAARLLGKGDVQLYDGSWSEWGASPSTPKATGKA